MTEVPHAHYDLVEMPMRLLPKSSFFWYQSTQPDEILPLLHSWMCSSVSSCRWIYIRNEKETVSFCTVLFFHFWEMKIFHLKINKIKKKEKKKSCEIPLIPLSSLWRIEIKTQEAQNLDRLFQINSQISFLFYFILIFFFLNKEA